jgi:cytoskeletal protein RodZ
MQVGDTVTRNELAPSIDQRQLWGSQIKAARESAGIPIEAISSSFNLRESFVGALESGEGNIHMEWPYERQHLQAIAKMLGVTLNDEITQ